MTIAEALAALPPIRAGKAAPHALAERRAMTAESLKSGMWRSAPALAEAKVDEIVLAGHRALAFRATGKPLATVVHLHGGGFRQGAPELIAGYAAMLAAACDVDVVCPAYGLAPERPFPAGLHDALAVVSALIDAGAANLILAGDSAGGGIAASAAAICAAHRVPLAGLVLHSPWLDVTVSSECFERNAATDPLFSRQSAEEAAALYLQGHPATDPLASSLMGDVDGLPPVFLSVGSGEVLACDSWKYKERLEAQGIPVQLCEVDGMEHVAVTRGMELTGSQEVFAATRAFIRGLASLPAR
ncbi:MAG TPA: alpha/beta hydrolase fold domain-containing protein [Novosphingobium sp.]|nr:alpha/beta hydrolase fold domain-containing protein [Novosphingobium sp.]